MEAADLGRERWIWEMGVETRNAACGGGNDLARVSAGKSVRCWLYTGVDPLLAVPLANQRPESLRAKQAFDIGLHSDVVHQITVFFLFNEVYC
jgi:hypothetical protein